MKKLLSKLRPLIVVIALALVVLINALIGDLGGLHFDLTPRKAATPVAEAMDVVNAVNEPVELYIVETDDTRNVWLDELLDRFAAANGKITLESVDPSSARLETVQALADGETLADGSILVRSEKRSVALDSDDLFSYEIDQMTYYYSNGEVINYTSADFTAQDALCRALTYVTRDDMPVLYVLSGHGENGWDGALNAICFRNNIALETLTLAPGEAVPVDAAAVLLCNPASPVGEETVDALMDYLKNGGDMLLLTSYNTDFTGLDRLVGYYGMARRAGLVVDNDTSHVYSSDYKYYLKPDLREHDITAPLIEAKQRVIMPVTEAITRSDVRRAGLNAQPLLMTSAKAYLKTNTDAVSTLDQEEGDIPGQFIVGMAAAEGDTRLVWLSCATFIAAGVSGASGGGNDALIESAFRQMFDFPAQAEALPAVSLITEPLSLPMVPALIALIALPLICLLIGLIRRRKYAA